MNKLSLVLSLLGMIVASNANAGLLLEPYLGYGQQPITYDVKASPGESKDLGQGALLGGRVGFAAPLVFVAADYSMTNMNMKNTQAASGTTAADYTAQGSTLYGVVGVKVPLVQAYAGYGLMNQLTAKPTSGDATYSGNAYKVGFGYTGFPVISVNLEYQMNSYNKLKTTSGEQDVSAVYNKYDSNSLMLSLSAPFRF